MINAPMSNSSFVLRKVAIGDHNYLGNYINFPAAARTGANCLLATKVMVPDRRPGARERRAARIARFRDPARRRHATCSGKVALSDGGAAAAGRGEDPLQRRHHDRLSVEPLGDRRGRPVRADRRCPALQVLWLSVPLRLRLARDRVYTILFFALMERGSLGFGRCRPQIVSMYDRRLLVPRAALEVLRHALSPARPARPLQGHALQEPDHPPARREARPARVRRRLPVLRQDACWRSATTRTSTRAAPSRPTRSRKACSSPTTSRSATAARSAAGRWCTTASTSPTTSSSSRTPSS